MDDNADLRAQVTALRAEVLRLSAAQLDMARQLRDITALVQRLAETITPPPPS